MSKTVELKVGMSCQGCAGAVRRVLGKMEGVESFDIDMETKKVTVKGNVEPEAVFEAVSKTGKPTSFWEAAPAPAVVSPAAAAPAVEAPIIAAPAVVSPAAAAPAAEAPIIAAPAAEPESKPTETVVVA